MSIITNEIFSHVAILVKWGLSTGAQSEIYKGRGGFVELGHFDKPFVKRARKKTSQGKISELCLLDTLKTTFWMEDLTQGWT